MNTDSIYGGAVKPEDDRKIDFLKNIYFFHSMPEESLHKILALCTEHRYRAGDVVFFEGMPGDCFYIVLEGELEIWKRYGQTDGVLLGVSAAGQPVGEMSLIDNHPRSATVRARTDTRVFIVEARDFDSLLKTDNSICVTLLRSVTQMVRRSNESHLTDLDRQNRELASAYAELQTVQDELLSRERLSVIGKFSSLILHDIRNPLSALRSRVELLRLNHCDESYFTESILKINSDITRMEMLAAEFLDYARGEIRLEMSICSLDHLFARFTESIQQKADRYGVSISVSNTVDRPVVLDENRILRALINAGENACKAMPSGGDLRLRASCSGDYLVIEIEDSGTGMSSEVLSHIFEPFYSASASGGTGLGMLIIKSIVEAHKGAVSLISEEGRGTTVTLSLPLFS